MPKIVKPLSDIQIKNAKAKATGYTLSDVGGLYERKKMMQAYADYLYGFLTAQIGETSNIHGTSHAVFKTPWIGDPRINIQGDKGKAKAYQVRQVLQAIEKLREINHEKCSLYLPDYMVTRR